MLLLLKTAIANTSHMKVNPNRDIPPDASVSSKAKPPAQVNATEEAEFTSSTDLTKKLAATSGMRADEVARAKALIADSNYPDAKTVRAIASHLADKIQIESDPKP